MYYGRREKQDHCTTAKGKAEILHHSEEIYKIQPTEIRETSNKKTVPSRERLKPAEPEVNTDREEDPAFRHTQTDATNARLWP